MSWTLDARLPVIFAPAASAGSDDALLIEAGATAPPGHPVARLAAGRAAAPAHVAGCACCLPRGAVAAALGALFLARARGEVAFFRRVIADVTDPSAVRAALQNDPASAARFRLG
jgi:hypothetical protein